MTGNDRAVLYTLAIESGLRASELRSLTWADMDLTGNDPAVTIRAADAKNRRTDTLSLKPQTAAMLARWRDDRGGVDLSDPVFPGMPDPPSKMIRRDLLDAGVNSRDDAGRVVDFHALRHTFIANLARGGVHPKVAKSLARHSTITLTMDRYSHTSRGQRADALTALPDLHETPAVERSQMVATGTYDHRPNPPEENVTKSCHESRISQPNMAASGIIGATGCHSQKH